MAHSLPVITHKDFLGLHGSQQPPPPLTADHLQGDKRLLTSQSSLISTSARCEGTAICQFGSPLLTQALQFFRKYHPILNPVNTNAIKANTAAMWKQLVGR